MTDFSPVSHFSVPASILNMLTKNNVYYNKYVKI